MIPEVFATTTIAREGDAGAAWLAELPSIVDALLDRWQCEPDGEVMYGGVGVVVPVRDAVLKVSFPHPGNVHEPDAFVAWDGRGAVRLHDRDDDLFAMLLERAHPSTLAEVADSEMVLTTAGRLSRRLSIPAPPDLPRLSEQADEWEEQLHKDAFELPHGLSDHVLGAAVATVRELGHAQPELIVHGDFHPRNIIRADREPWLVVDPKGYVGDPAYDAATLLKVHSLTLLEAEDVAKAVGHALEVFAEAAELDRERVRRWAQLHVVQGAFWGRRHGFRRARTGPQLDPLIAYAEQMAALLT